jgi:hypothetical protein
MILKVISWLAVGFGVFSFVLELKQAIDGSGFQYLHLSFSIGVIVLGFLGLRYVKINHQGGAPTIVGALLVTLAVWMAVYGIERFANAPGNDLYLSFLISAMFLVGGIALLRSGHQWHLERKARGE